MNHSSNADMKGIIDAITWKSYLFLVYEWNLNPSEAAALAGLPVHLWVRAKEPGFAAELTEYQLHRIRSTFCIAKSLDRRFSSAITNQWFFQPNTDVLFGGRRPIDLMMVGGGDQLRAVQDYVDSLPELQ